MANYWNPTTVTSPINSGVYTVTMKGVGTRSTRVIDAYYDVEEDIWKSPIDESALPCNETVTAWMDKPEPYDSDLEEYVDRLHYLAHDIDDILQNAFEADGLVVDQSTSDIRDIYLKTLRRVAEKLYENLTLIAPDGFKTENGEINWNDDDERVCMIGTESTEDKCVDIMLGCLLDIDVALTQSNYEYNIDADAYTKTLERIRCLIDNAENEFSEIKRNEVTCM